MIKAAIFDKDGTLFDFRQSWGGWSRRLVESLVAMGGDKRTICDVLGYDFQTGQFVAHSPVIAATTDEIAQLIAPVVAGMDVQSVYALMNQLAQTSEMFPAVDLPVVITGLRERGLIIGLATNDTEAPATEHLTAAGVFELFDFVAGSDSGWGGKPAPGQLNAFARQFDLDPQTVVMVGDSLHDLEAGRAAGMKTVAVLTGIATQPELAPYADAVLQDISHLGDWIDQQMREVL
jgi:phosphoglycolate phosphatase